MESQTRGMNRRAFMAATGIGAAAVGTVSLGIPQLGSAAESSATEEANIKIVNRFLHIRWNATPIDYAELADILAEDCVRGGTDPTRLERGSKAILENLRQRAGEGVPTRFTYIVKQWASGSIVAHERYEGSGVGRNGRPPVIGRGVGVFQVADGKINEWRWFGTETGPHLKIPPGAFKP